jgi:hypothetical protein
MSSPDQNELTTEAVTARQDTVKDGRRREAMRRMARYAAPAMLALLIAEKAVAQSAE